MISQAQTIDKLDVNNIKYDNKDALSLQVEKRVRARKLNRALLLGNTFKESVQIFFKNADDLVFETKATVWGLTKNYVILKGARMIPINSVVDVAI